VASRVTEVIFDCHDLDRVSQFWSAALGYQQVNAGDGWIAIAEWAPDQKPSDEAVRQHAPAPVIAFVVVPESKVVKNRVHIDVTPIDRSRDQEVDRLMALGARRVDIGQGDVPWVVMADPEGNEFCVMPGLDA
jgi:hypothetical protein